MKEREKFILIFRGSKQSKGLEKTLKLNFHHGPHDPSHKGLIISEFIAETTVFNLHKLAIRCPSWNFKQLSNGNSLTTGSGFTESRTRGFFLMRKIPTD